MRVVTVFPLALATIITSANAQSLMVANNNAALERTANDRYPVVRAGFATPGDGGYAVYNYSASACSLNSGAGDNGSEVQASGGGCWNIDYGSIGDQVSPLLFESTTATDDTSAWQAAISTGHTVRAPKISRPWNITSDLKITTPRQIIEGCGEGYANPPGTCTTLNVASNASFNKGVFVSNTGEPGPDIRDLNVSFSQPSNPTSISQIIQYVPAFYMQGTPRYRLTRVGIFNAWVGIDARGNSGGSEVDNLEMSAFGVGVYEDGALDTTRFINPHFYPFGYPAQSSLSNLLNTNVVWFDVGEDDDLQTANGLILGGLQFNFHGPNNPAYPSSAYCSSTSIINTSIDSFDTSQGFAKVSCGHINISGGYIGSNISGGALGLNQSGGQVLISNQRFISFGGQSGSSGYPFMNVAGTWTNTYTSSSGATITCAPSSYCGVPLLSITNTPIYQNNDQPIITQYNGQVYFTNNQIFPSSQNSTTYAKIYVAKNAGQFARIMASFNIISDLAGGQSATFFKINTDDFSRVVYNVAPNWTNSFPSTGSGSGGAFDGIYSPN